MLPRLFGPGLFARPSRSSPSGASEARDGRRAGGDERSDRDAAVAGQLMELMAVVVVLGASRVHSERGRTGESRPVASPSDRRDGVVVGGGRRRGRRGGGGRAAGHEAPPGVALLVARQTERGGRVRVRLRVVVFVVVVVARGLQPPEVLVVSGGGLRAVQAVAERRLLSADDPLDGLVEGEPPFRVHVRGEGARPQTSDVRRRRRGRRGGRETPACRRPVAPPRLSLPTDERHKRDQRRGSSPPYTLRYFELAPPPSVCYPGLFDDDDDKFIFSF